MTWIALAIIVCIIPAVIYQIGQLMKEMRQSRLEEIKQRASMDARILGIDTTSSEIKVELAEIRRELAEIRKLLGGSALPAITPAEPQERHMDIRQEEIN